MAAVFEPTDEWKMVPEGADVPAGLEVRLDLSSGGKWARLPPNDQGDNTNALVSMETSPPRYDVSADVALDLSVLQELAHDVHHGEDIVHNHGAQLCRRVAADPKGSVAEARILSTAVRNNPRAAVAFPFDLLPTDDAAMVDATVLGLAAAFASTQQGLQSRRATDLLHHIRREIARRPLKGSAAAKLDSLVRTLAHTSPQDTLEWVEPVQRAVTISAPLDDAATTCLLRLAAAMVSQKDEFAPTTPETLTPEPWDGLVRWLSQAVSSAPPKSQELRDLIRSVRHRVFGNPMAERNHFDEL